MTYSGRPTQLCRKILRFAVALFTDLTSAKQRSGRHHIFGCSEHLNFSRRHLPDPSSNFYRGGGVN